MDIQQIARVCHEVNKAYCEAIGDHSQLSWEDAEQWQRDSAIAGVKYKMDNPTATPEDQHKAWMNDKLMAGWTYGPVKQPNLKIHNALLPYQQLPIEQKIKDNLFQAVVKSLVSNLATAEY